MSGHPRAPPEPLQPARGWRGGGALRVGQNCSGVGMGRGKAARERRMWGKKGTSSRRGIWEITPPQAYPWTLRHSLHVQAPDFPSRSLITAVPHVPLQERNSRSISGAVGHARPGLPFITARLMLGTRRFIGAPCPQGCGCSVPRAAPHTQILNWQRPPGQGTAGSTAQAGSACRRCSPQCPPSDQMQIFPLIQCIFSTLLLYDPRNFM